MNKTAQKRIKDIRIIIYRPQKTDMFIKVLLHSGLKQLSGEGMYSLNSFDIVMNNKHECKRYCKNWKLYSIIASNYPNQCGHSWHWVLDSKGMPIDVKCNVEQLMCMCANDKIIKFKNKELLEKWINPIIVADTLDIELSDIEDNREFSRMFSKCYGIAIAQYDLAYLATSGMASGNANDIINPLQSIKNDCLITHIEEENNNEQCDDIPW